MATCPALPVVPPDGRPFDLPVGLDDLRAIAPVVRVDIGGDAPVWLITRYAEARAVLADPRFSSDITRPGFPVAGLPGTATPSAALRMVRRDAPDHSRLRRLTTGDFTVRRAAEWSTAIEEIVASRLDAVRTVGPGVDLVAEFALPVPSLVISALLGVPEEHLGFFQERSAVMVANTAPPDVVVRAQRELEALISDLVDRRRREPGPDVLSRLVVEDLAGGALEEDELVSYAVFLLAAGHETTASMIGLSAYSLMRRPDLLPTLFAGGMPGRRLVDELLRVHSITRLGPRRVATEPVIVAGTEISPGEGVVIAMVAANRDPETYADPEVVDPARGVGHLAFGFGPHQCLGQNLARLELQIALSALFAGLPGLAPLRDEQELILREDYASYGLASLPVTWATGQN